MKQRQSEQQVREELRKKDLERVRKKPDEEQEDLEKIISDVLMEQ